MEKKVCVITGAASGMGYATIQQMPKECQLVIADIQEEMLRETVEKYTKLGYDISFRLCDISKREDVRALAEYAAEKGEIERVIHVAGVSGSMNNQEMIFRINSLGTVYINQEFFKVMNSGCILNVCSNSAYSLPKSLLPTKYYSLALRKEDEFINKMLERSNITKDATAVGSISYCISKNFVKWYSSKCSYKYALKGIRVLSVSPGFVDTPMTLAEKDTPGATLCKSYSGFNRGATPDELAYLFVALSDPRCGYLCGTDVLCDGGSIAAGFGMITTLTNKPPRITENY